MFSTSSKLKLCGSATIIMLSLPTVLAAVALGTNCYGPSRNTGLYSWEQYLKTLTPGERRWLKQSMKKINVLRRHCETKSSDHAMYTFKVDSLGNLTDIERIYDDSPQQKQDLLNHFDCPSLQLPSDQKAFVQLKFEKYPKLDMRIDSKQ